MYCSSELPRAFVEVMVDLARTESCSRIPGKERIGRRIGCEVSVSGCWLVGAWSSMERLNRYDELKKNDEGGKE